MTQDSGMIQRHEGIQRPLFVVGALRSGTTMFSLMLDGHPQICNFGEFEYAVSYAIGDDFPDVSTYRQLLEVDRLYRAQGFRIDERLTYHELVDSFLHQAVEHSGKPIVSATVHSRFDLLPKLWPGARYLHLVRDPRDVSRSCIGMGWAGNVWYGADIWVQAESRWKRLAESLLPTDWLEIRFEELVNNTKNVLSEVCGFLELEYSDSMLEYPNQSTYEAPDSKLANQWRRKLTSHDIGLVELKCSPLMESLGYSIESPSEPISWIHRAVLGIDNRLKRWRFRIKHYGFGLFLQWKLAQRIGTTRSAWSRRVMRRVNEVKDANVK